MKLNEILLTCILWSLKIKIKKDSLIVLFVGTLFYIQFTFEIVLYPKVWSKVKKKW